MLKFLRYISSEPRINQIFGFIRIFLGTINACPVRDNIWVETRKYILIHRAVRYGMCQGTRVQGNHIASQPAVGHVLRLAGLWALFFFYRYVVPRMGRNLRPPGQSPSVKSFNQCKPVIPC